MSGLQVLRRGLAALLLSICLLLSAALPAQAGPVEWQELPPSSEGQQWWDAGSLRLNRQGNLTVLSRYLSSSPDASPASRLYVMEIDCGQTLFRDTSINGIPQWNSPWQPSGADGLIEETIAAVCAAGTDLLASR